MRKLSILILFCLAVQTARTQFVCNDEIIMNVKGKWKKLSDANMIPDKNQAQINSRIDNISKFFQTAYPDPKGAEAEWYRSMTQPILNNAPTSYSFNSLYKAWYCNTHVNKLLLGAETGTWAYVFVNTFSWFMSNQYDKLTITLNGLNIYTLPRKKGSWKGYPLYEASAHRIRNCIILTRPGQLPWKPVTQEQYLKALRSEWSGKKKEVQKMYVKMDSSQRKSIQNTQNNNYLQPADKQKIIAGLQKSLGDFQKTRETDSTKQVSHWNGKILIIDNYLSQAAPQVLQQPAVIKNYNDFTGEFTPEEKGGYALVTINPAYFNKQLPAYMPQMMILYWRWEGNTPSQDFKKQFEENFPVEKLQAMIDH